MLKRFIYILFLFSVSCIDPFSADVDQGEQILTVEGLVTSGPGPHVIKLSRSATYGSVFQGLIRPVQGATMILKDDQGKVTLVTEDPNKFGTYETAASFSAEIGRLYTLQFQLVSGEVYVSAPEKIEAAPEIKKLSVKTVQIPVEGKILFRSGAQIFAEIDDPGDQNNFYLWRNAPSTYVLEARPDLFVIRSPNAPPVPAPKACCYVCYRQEVVGNQSLFIAQDDTFNGLTTTLPVSFIEDNGLRLVNTFRTDIMQIRITPEAYRFLKLIRQQTETSGSVFDPPPASIRGNISRLDKPEEVVLGYFIAGGETRKRIYIKRDDLTFNQPRVIIPDDCRVVSGPLSDIVPSDWNPNN
jgi:hypothetical protein